MQCLGKIAGSSVSQILSSHTSAPPSDTSLRSWSPCAGHPQQLHLVTLCAQTVGSSGPQPLPGAAHQSRFLQISVVPVCHIKSVQSPTRICRTRWIWVDAPCAMLVAKCLCSFSRRVLAVATTQSTRAMAFLAGRNTRPTTSKSQVAGSKPNQRNRQGPTMPIWQHQWPGSSLAV